MPVKKLCVTCKKSYSCKSGLNRHVKNIHDSQRNVRRFKRQQDNDELRNFLVKSRNFLKNLCDTVEKTNELARSLETNIEDADDVVGCCEGRINVHATAGNHVIHEVSKSFTGSQSNPRVQPFSALHSNLAVQTGEITGDTQLILPRRRFVPRNGRPDIAKVCVPCFQVFANKSNLKRHNKTFHRPHVQPPVDNDPRQSGEMNGVGTSQTKFENGNNQVDVASQTDFLMIDQ